MNDEDRAAIRSQVAKKLEVIDGGLTTGEPAPPWLKPYAWRAPAEIPARQWLYGQHYVRDYLTGTFAPGGGGKSLLALAEAMAMATGKPLLGIDPGDRYRVGYWNGEDPIEETERRVAGLMMRFGLTREDLEGWLFWGSGRDQQIIVAEQTRDGTLINHPVVERVKATITEFRLDAVIIDPFVSCHRVAENDNGAVDAVAKLWGGIAGSCNVAAEMIHHTTKAAIGREVRAEDGRGGGALLFAARSARVLNTMSEDEAQAAGVSLDKRRFYFRVDNGKANLAPPAARSAWYRITSESLGNGAFGADGDSVGVVTPWEWPGAGAASRPKAPKLTLPGQTLMAAFGRLIDEGKTCPAPNVPGVMPGTIAVQDSELRKMATTLGICSEPQPDRTDKAAHTKWQSAARAAWKRGTDQVRGGSLLRFEDGFWWELRAARVTSRDNGD